MYVETLIFTNKSPRPQAPLLQQLAFFDAALVAEEPLPVARRRQQVFADESGARWRAVAVPCMQEVSDPKS